jgi:type IV pilus assembly protein PilX
MDARHQRPHSPGQRGAALVVGLLLLVVLTMLAISGMATASLELRMAGNEQYRKRAFQAADAAIERAIQAGVYDTVTTIGTYAASGDPAMQPSPVRGTGVRGCIQTTNDDGSLAASGDCYEYFMRFDGQTGPTAVPNGDPGSGTELRAYHFVIDAYGRSGRGAVSHHVQGFYIVGPTPPAPAPFCLFAAENCGTVLAHPPVRTYWGESGES